MTPRFAWPSYAEPWECAITAVDFDGREESSAIDSDHLRVDAFDGEWSAATLAVTASTNQPPPDGLQNLRGHVLLSCTPTQLRRSYPIAMIGGEVDPSFKGALIIPRSAVSGKATIIVEVVGEDNGRQRVVGSSVPWAIVVDKAEAPDRPGIPPLKTIWVDFAGSDAPAEARRNVAAHAYVDVASAPPILYLNKGIDGLQSLILADKPKLERKRHRDLLSAYIARYVANSLFRAAAEQVTTDEFGGEPEGPTSRVFRDVCEAVAAELPDTETVEDLYEVITRLPDGPPDSAMFWADVDLALDRMTAVSSTVAQITEQVKRV